MSDTFTHNCIKCTTQYSSNEADPYYCDLCIKEKERIAKEVDQKLASRPRKQIKTALQSYDEARGKMPFPSINSLGIKL